MKKLYIRFSAAWVYISQASITCFELYKSGLRDAYLTFKGVQI